jgi:serine/threonine protein kinase/tetratricopeptide (TPR) repeat protein
MKSDALFQAAEDEAPRRCPACGTPYVDGNGALGCPVCLFRRVLEPGSEGDPGLPGDGRSLPDVGRFDHYEIARRDDGAFDELGRGAMGVTYKAFDVHLRRPVTLKVIGEKYVGDESARVRFLREARAAASLRHPNVASVFHLGRTGQNYFYAMEFVEGETLENLIKRSGRLEVKLALEIATQVAAGLAAIHKQKLVHRDIKPTNIMVSMEEGGTLIAKIIDLGLAKPASEAPVDAAISIPGAFTGTPEFASPEQFGGVGVSIRSDLYSLGVVLWEMVTGHTVFKGSLAHVMYQHQHAPLPIEALEHVPQPLAFLLETLLEKDPGRRFQSPAEFLKAVVTVTTAIEARRRITRQSLRETPPAASLAVIRESPTRPGPEKISVARLPVTGSDVFGREEDIAFLDEAWTSQHVNVVTIVAWAGVGKSTLVNYWLRRMAAKQYSSAELVFGWSLYRQGAIGNVSSAEEFLDAALNWFGDPDPRLGTGWEKGERLAKLVAHRRTLLILDGLESLQNPPGPQEGRVRESSLHAFLREVAAFNTGLCIITTRTPVADIADHDGTSALRRDLEQLSSDAGAKLLRAMGVKGQESELRSASEEFSGHCLALTLLGSYLTDAYKGDIRCRSQVSGHLAQDVRQGAHAREVMKSYQAWLGEGPDLAVLRMLGLFDRPADEKALGALLESPAIPGLTESLTDLSPTAWRTILAKLRRAKLLAEEDPYNPRQLDTHPLVREYFGEQLRSQRIEACKECNRRLFHYYRTLAPQLPNSFREMEPLFSAVICGCDAGLFREALHEVYIPRIQRGNTYFAAKVLGARGPLLSVLIHFFEHGRWGSHVEKAGEEHSLSTEDQLFILMQAGLYLAVTRGQGNAEARTCYERAEPMCHALNHPRLLYVALIGQWRHALVTGKLSAAMQVVERAHTLAQEQNDAALMIGTYRSLSCTWYFLGDFEPARQCAVRGLQISRSGNVQSYPEEYYAPVVGCLCYGAMSEWHLGETASCQANIEEAISIANELKDMNALASALNFATILAYFERNPADVERIASALIELSTRHNFVHWLANGAIYRGWARSAAGDTAKGIPWIEQGIRDFQASGAVLGLPAHLARKAEALHLADRTSEALEAINAAEEVAERFEQRWWSAELHRLRGVFLMAVDADETQIETSFCAAIKIAQDQKSISLKKRAEATCAEYRRQKV